MGAAPAALNDEGGCVLLLVFEALLLLAEDVASEDLLDAGRRQLLHQRAVGLPHLLPAEPGLQPQRGLRPQHILDELTRVLVGGEVVAEVVEEGQPRAAPLHVHKLQPGVRHEAVIQQRILFHWVDWDLHAQQLHALLVDELEEVAVQRVVLVGLLGDLVDEVHLAVVVLKLLPLRGDGRVHRRLRDGHQIDLFPRVYPKILGHFARLLGGRGIGFGLLL
mmetsp:Transcript_28420/g.47720  ORF Transcript_28420/g.47720 Transcript_28420/m.47720 type:complete len:220 (-) Transcript_28420:957-1616(-)